MTSVAEEAQSARVFVCPYCEQPALGQVRGIAVWDGCGKEGQEPNMP
jgi:hypothetical protein